MASSVVFGKTGPPKQAAQALFLAPGRAGAGRARRASGTGGTSGSGSGGTGGRRSRATWLVTTAIA